MKNWAVILGASSGIGLECALRLAKNGINIYGLYLRKKSSEVDYIINEIKRFNVEVIYKKANASNEENRQIILEELKKISKINIKFLIHSIAFGTLKKMIDKDKNELSKKNIDMTMDVMCNNLIYWSQDLFHNNLFSKGSHILSMTSSGGRKNWENYGAVSMAKASLESVTRQLSIELAPHGIAVNTIQAGVTDTKALRLIPGADKMIKKATKLNPHQRLTTPSDIADFLELLINYNSSWMTGNIIRIDGGEDITN
jgi:enoyl-[acyl-carrier-protein] reductase (NADH)